MQGVSDIDYPLVRTDYFLLFIAVIYAHNTGFAAKHVINKPYLPAH